MSKRHRQLLPAPKADNADVESPVSGLYLTPSEDEPFKRPRIGTQLACDSCRRRKIRVNTFLSPNPFRPFNSVAQCNGERPHCRACQQRGEVAPCVYADSRGQRQPAEESEQLAKLFELIKSVSERQALDILRIIRSHDDIKDIMSIVQASHGSEHDQASPGRLPISTRHTRLEHELMSTNPVSFPPLRSAESDILKLATFPRAYLSIVLRVSLHARTLTRSRIAAGTRRHATGGGIESQSSSSAAENSMPSDKPNTFNSAPPPVNLVNVAPPPDSRLAELDMSFWTTVPIPNDLAAKVLALYLETDHPLLGTFDPDLFLDDLVNRRSRYCSGVLVSALMYWGCVGGFCLRETITTGLADIDAIANVYCLGSRNQRVFIQVQPRGRGAMVGRKGQRFSAEPRRRAVAQPGLLESRQRPPRLDVCVPGKRHGDANGPARSQSRVSGQYCPRDGS